MERCILPCSFQVDTHVVIHWIQLTKGELRVHLYYDDQDQLEHQHQNYRNRTSLFKDQISRGNASLQLTGVKVQDEGRYKCYTSTINGNEDSFINLKVKGMRNTQLNRNHNINKFMLSDWCIDLLLSANLHLLSQKLKESRR
uniref:Ig-like domain-containing protein n=1 Tax=Acanthochromis polyacanthus TaxID=80966 RepID=A0A3Q1FL92_9TELE